MSAPAIACPASCTRRHGPHDVMQNHECLRPGGEDASLTLDQTGYGDDTPDLGHLNGQLHIHLLHRISSTQTAGMVAGLDETGQLLRLLAVLGREDIAATVTELAVIAGAGPAGGGR